MALIEEDTHFIKLLWKSKGYSSRRYLKQFPNRGWSRSCLDKLLCKIDATGSIQLLPGSGRRRTARTVENIEAVEALVLSQEDMPQTHRTQRQIAREIDIRQSSVNQIIKQNLRLKCFKQQKTQELTLSNKQARSS